jgi:hypothetical protein
VANIKNRDHLKTIYKENIMASLAEIRARLTQQDTKQQNKNAPQQGDRSTYPHWNMEEGTIATVRFLPDADPNNPFFWVEKQVIKLTFNGVLGDPNSKRVEVSVPCIEMYPGNEKCPILTEVRTWYKDESMTEMANKYWKKRSFIYQGFVRANPIATDETPENPIRKFVITSSIHNIIKTSLMDPELMETPVHYTQGLDFNIRKTMKGGYADYATSGWSRRESPLTEAELAAIDAHGLHNLSDFLPKKPSSAELAIIKEMFEASVDGKPYDVERWGSFYRPYGIGATGAPASGETKAPATPAATSRPVVAETKQETAPWEDDAIEAANSPIVVPAKTSAPSDKTDIMALIRSRQANKG